MDRELQKYYDRNKVLWDRQTQIHKSSAFYDLDGFRKTRDSLKEPEISGLGDVSGKNILHLQCHFGMDTISLSLRGADVTGVDISSESIQTAKSLASELGSDARFIESNIFDLQDHLNEQFDIVFTSYGVITWLHDLGKWADLINSCLNEDGFFYIVEFHPLLWTLDESYTSVAHPYFNSGQPLEEIVKESYVGEEEVNLEEYTWNHSLGDVLSSLLDKGLKLESFQEYDYSSYNCFPDMKSIGQDQWVNKTQGRNIPYMFSLRARK